MIGPVLTVFSRSYLRLAGNREEVGGVLKGDDRVNAGWETTGVAPRGRT